MIPIVSTPNLFHSFPCSRAFLPVYSVTSHILFFPFKHNAIYRTTYAWIRHFTLYRYITTCGITTTSGCCSYPYHSRMVCINQSRIIYCSNIFICRSPKNLFIARICRRNRSHQCFRIIRPHRNLGFIKSNTRNRHTSLGFIENIIPSFIIRFNYKINPLTINALAVSNSSRNGCTVRNRATIFLNTHMLEYVLKANGEQAISF